VALTYSFASRFDGYGVAELAKTDKKVVDLRCRLGGESEVEDHHLQSSQSVA
jgi:hypothetical protein